MDFGRSNDTSFHITANIQQLNQNVRSLNVCVDRMGGAEDTDINKASMSELIENSNKLLKETMAMIKELDRMSKDNRQLQLQKERLANEYIAVLNRLQAAQRKAASKEKAQIKNVTYEDQMILSTPREDRHSQIELQQQHRVNLEEIKERQQALETLESDINDINEIFKDLARIVHDQGDMVDSIEANIEQSTVRIEQARHEINSAVTYQSKARQKKLLLLIFFIAIVLILILVIYLYSK